MRSNSLFPPSDLLTHSHQQTHSDHSSVLNLYPKLQFLRQQIEFPNWKKRKTIKQKTKPNKKKNKHKICT